MNLSWSFSVIGEVESPYKEKFAIPRQPNLADAAIGRIRLFPSFNNLDAFAGLEQFSHIWLSFIFHQTASQGWKPSVRPPRLGGNKKMGVFATRSTFRPNPIGLSCVKLLSVETIANQVYINISGLDLLDKTPIIDIKPYLPYADKLLDATSDFCPEAPALLASVVFAPELTELIHTIELTNPEFSRLVEQVLRQDPRPAYQKSKNNERIYGMQLFDWNIRWRVKENTCFVQDIIAV